MSIIDPLPHHVSPFGGSVSPFPGMVFVGVRLGVAVGVVGVGVEVVGLGLGGGDVVGRGLGVTDVLTVAEGVGEGRSGLLGETGALLIAGFVLLGRTLDGVTTGLGEVNGSAGRLSPPRSASS